MGFRDTWASQVSLVVKNPPANIGNVKDMGLILAIIRDWNAKIGSQETPGIMGKFGFGVQNEAEQRLIELCQENWS